MSGIAGVWSLDRRPVEPQSFEPLLERLSHRGPDGSAVWLEGDVGLGHLRFATTTGSGERLPLAAGSGALHITADARIDNREELEDALGLEGGAGRARGDGELILRAYDRWGEHCAERLLGDFAFAIRDARRDSLFCARDPFGVKPFYYHYRQGRIFAFASEIKALLSLDMVTRRLNDVWIADFLVRLFEDPAITPYAGIVRLPAAHTLCVERDGFSLRRYWAPDPEREIRFRSNAEYADRFRELFVDAVSRRVEGPRRAGAMLSGGLDSSSVACVAAAEAARSGRPPVPTFSQVFHRSASADERPYVEAVLARGGMEPHLLDGDLVSPLHEVDELVRELDAPPYCWNLALTRATYRAAAPIAPVLLDGLHGDNTLFSHGDLHLADLLRAGRIGSAARLALAHGRAYPGRSWAAFKKYGLRPLIPGPVLAGWRMVRRRSGPAAPRVLIRQDFARRIGIDERRARLRGRLDSPFTDARRSHLVQLSAGITVRALEIADMAAAHAAVEPRYPFLDRRLVEFCLAVPSAQKFLDGWPRSVIRRAMAGMLPEQIRWRRGKRGTAEWYARNLVAFARPRLERLLLQRHGPLVDYVDPAALREAVFGFLATGSSHLAHALWEPLVLLAWLERMEQPAGSAARRARSAGGSSNTRSGGQGERTRSAAMHHPPTGGSYMKPYSTPELEVFGGVEALTRARFLKGGPPIQPPGKLDTGPDALGQRSRIESLDGPATGLGQLR